MPGRHSHRPRARLRGPVALLATVAVAAGTVWSCSDDRAPQERPATVARQGEASRAGRTPGAVAVLHSWDRARAAAWARGDVGALRRLYLPGSAAGDRDIAMLRRWSARGLRVRRVRMQVLATRARLATADRLVLVVTDRLASGAVVERTAGPTDLRLPRDGVSTRRLAFRRTADRWVLASVRDVAG
ncbi:hypothetical protein MF406_18235 (plasmid) [Georgenia sp. TF02-10]|uniref:hypothetical protein n=1 Tax=Georgenia sp. TF02-10 TaxID=2917725 RepID=UPI001FA7C912|nr:hypothetical protein [Georgenia sp. TF02-10]UNX56585.1 hypothetical protein MF406_18235 [Georgenia sp. TF02-10]